MRAPSSGPDRGSWRPKTANDLFKSSWGTRLTWGTTLAAVLHIGLFVWSPSWERVPPPQRSSGWLGMEAVALYEAPYIPGAIPTVTVLSTPEEEPLVEPSDAEEGSTGDADWELAGRGAARLEALRRRMSPTPALVEEDPSQGMDEEGETLRIGAQRSTPGFDEFADARALELDRLTAIRPELAFLSPSSWVLVQNPAEAVDFMVKNFGRGDAPYDEMGTVSVSLWIDERGSVEWAEVNRSSGRADVDELALEFFSEVISFRPAREQGVRVPVAVIFSLTVPR